MKLSNHGKTHVNIFGKHNCIPSSQTDLSAKTENILECFYDDLLDAHDILTHVKKQAQRAGTNYYEKTITKITGPSQIIRSKNTGSKFFPAFVETHINATAQYMVDVRVTTEFKRKVRIIFITEEESDHPILHPSTIDKYVSLIYTWINVVHNYAKIECSQMLTIYVYLTSLKKRLPDTSEEVIGVNNVNSAYTIPCSEPSEIIIYRKEEWFKVLLHESFHNFALDFATNPSDSCVKRILEFFPIESEVNLFEAYTESWAEIMNLVFFSFFKTHPTALTTVKEISDKNYENNLETFLGNFREISAAEINYSVFQMVKMLNHMGLNYESIHSQDAHMIAKRDDLYKEGSHVFAYYIAKCIILFNYQSFLAWCGKHNDNILQFKETDDNQHAFCEFIEKRFNNKRFLNSVSCCEQLFKRLSKMRVASDDPIIQSACMTLCEWTS
jgi:hypothetical protein